MNVSGRSAGRSQAALTVTGAAPAAVQGLNAKGSRIGILIGWDEASAQSGEVILQRENLTKAGIAELAAPGGSNSNRLLDTSAKVNVRYRYTSTRSRSVQLGDRSIELRSAASPSVEVTLTPIYPPLAPVGLTAAAFNEGGFAIDLIWQPVDDTGLIVPLAGYNVYRSAGDASPSQLNTSPVAVPAFHDATAIAGVNYRYRVTAVDSKGNESLGVFVSVGRSVF